jgi:hypothetical protein
VKNPKQVAVAYLKPESRGQSPCEKKMSITRRSKKIGLAAALLPESKLLLTVFGSPRSTDEDDKYP